MALLSESERSVASLSLVTTGLGSFFRLLFYSFFLVLVLAAVFCHFLTPDSLLVLQKGKAQRKGGEKGEVLK